MNKKIYCFNCDKDVNALCEVQTNTYIVHKQEVKVNEQIFKCPYCENELINENLNGSLYLIYNEYLKLHDLSFDKLKK